MARLRDMAEGSVITMVEGRLNVPDEPIIHYIEGDGIGVDITPVMIDTVNAAVERAYSETRRIHWSEVLAGEKAFNATGEWMPEATLEAMRNGLGSLKGPLTTPVGGGIRSIEHIKKLLDFGIDKVIIGTAAVKNIEFFKTACEKFKNKIVLSLDAREGHIAL